MKTKAQIQSINYNIYTFKCKCVLVDKVFSHPVPCLPSLSLVISGDKGSVLRLACGVVCV